MCALSRGLRVGKPTGFLETARRGPQRRPVAVRLRDWREVYVEQSDEVTREQAGRCMDCGIPFCHNACPLGNLIPEWNDLVYNGHHGDALARLHATNNFPEFTGRLCPAPCESACVVAIADEAITIERIEYEIIERGFAEGLVTPQHPAVERGFSIGIVGSGPAGLAAAQQLRRAGYAVVVYERQSKIGGLLRFGIPEFKMEKAVIDRRLAQMTAEGVEFVTDTAVGIGGNVTLEELRIRHDAVLLAIGSTRPRLLDVPGSGLEGIVPAMDYLTPANVAVDGPAVPRDLSAAGRHVVILGGGDTGADCLGTAHRQGAASITQIEIMDQPPLSRPDNQPWPTMPLLFKVSSAHEEGGEREFAVETTQFVGDSSGRVRALVVHDRGRDGAQRREIPAELILIAAGFVGPELEHLSATPIARTERDNVRVDANWLVDEARDNSGSLFACGDAVRGQSLIVWALAEGRSAAAAIDRSFSHGHSTLGEPVTPNFAPWG